MSDQLYVVVGNRGFEPSDTDGVVPWLWESSEGAKLKADHLNKFESTKEYYPAAVFIVRKEWVEAVQSRADELDRLRAENERLRAALEKIANYLPMFDYVVRDDWGKPDLSKPGSPYDRGREQEATHLSGIARAVLQNKGDE